MALRKDIPTAPETRPDPKHETTYQASRGGHHRAPRAEPERKQEKDRR